jgi:hypothetical protein
VTLLIVRSVLRGGRAVAVGLEGPDEVVAPRLGTLTWYSGFSTAVALARKRAGDGLVRAVDVASGLGLVAFGGVLAYRAATE